MNSVHCGSCGSYEAGIKSLFNILLVVDFQADFSSGEEAPTTHIQRIE
jgi:hypothetical protein